MVVEGSASAAHASHRLDHIGDEGDCECIPMEKTLVEINEDECATGAGCCGRETADSFWGLPSLGRTSSPNKVVVRCRIPRSTP